MQTARAIPRSQGHDAFRLAQSAPPIGSRPPRVPKRAHGAGLNFLFFELRVREQGVVVLGESAMVPIMGSYGNHAL